MCFRITQRNIIRMYAFPLFAVLVAVSVSCTVLENRSACPCTLYLDMSDPANGVCDTLTVNVWTPEGFSSLISVPRDEYGKVRTIEIPSRRGAGICVIDASASSRYICGAGGGVFIPTGEQCPQAYMYSSFCETGAEWCSDTVRVSKNFCGVTLNFISPDMELYEIKITGNVSGYSSMGEPVPGIFEYSPEGSGQCYFRIPRQTDESLQLGISVSGGHEKIFALGQYIRQSGYDWTRRDLEDLAVTIDYASTSLVITIDEWSTTVEYDVVV